MNRIVLTSWWELQVITNCKAENKAYLVCCCGSKTDIQGNVWSGFEPENLKINVIPNPLKLNKMNKSLFLLGGSLLYVITLCLHNVAILVRLLLCKSSRSACKQCLLTILIGG